MHETIEKAAREHGFSAAYFLSPMSLPLWRDTAFPQHTDCGMDWDIPAAFSQATCVVLLARAYLPYAREERILPYYIAENQAYFAAKALAREISAGGFFCENAWLPARALALGNGVGSPSRNGLLSLDGLGTRVSLFTLATNACSPLAYAPDTSACPDVCDACVRACPTGAITREGLDATKCLRYFMDDAVHPPFVLEKLASFLGCDVCQRVCPKNARLGAAELPSDVRAAFDLRRLIRGDAKDARALVGRNITGGGKLTVEAIAIAAREHLFEEDIRTALLSPHGAVRDAARWALEMYF
jgi:epoxyqueuosine reductase QueG